jgi:cell wall-associated NlpC family hydrolase
MDRGDFATVATRGLMGRLIRLVTRSRVNHAMIYVGDGLVIEAQPSGAARTPMALYTGHNLHWSALPLTDLERDHVVAAAVAHLGAPYSWVDDACIALARLLDVHVPGPVRRRLAGKDHLMCSQLVDVCYSEAGIRLFTDNRLPGDVTPGDLDALITAGDHAGVTA